MKSGREIGFLSLTQFTLCYGEVLIYQLFRLPKHGFSTTDSYLAHSRLHNAAQAPADNRFGCLHATLYGVFGHVYHARQFAGNHLLGTCYLRGHSLFCVGSNLQCKGQYHTMCPCKSLQEGAFLHNPVLLEPTYSKPQRNLTENKVMFPKAQHMESSLRNFCMVQGPKY